MCVLSFNSTFKGPRSPDDNVSDCRCMYECLTADTGAEFDLGLPPYFSGDLILK